MRENPKIQIIINSVIQEGCIEETLAAVEAHYKEYLAQDCGVKSTLKEIAEDETRHAKLAWDTVSWITKKYPEYNNFMGKTFDDQLKKQERRLSDLASTSQSSLCLDERKDELIKA